MSSKQIIEAFKQLPFLERQIVLEAILRVEREGPTTMRQRNRAEKRARLAAGAAMMATEYQQSQELTAFTDLNTEDIYEYETR